jgi:Tol biopolymer transport system component
VSARRILLACLFTGTGCVGFGVPEYKGFGTPERVTLRGYDGISMEPFVSSDGRWLFYNNSNAPDVNTQLRYAERVDDVTFDDRGEIGQVNTRALDGVASMDRDNQFYFVSLRSYDADQESIFRGVFNGDRIDNVVTVAGLSKREAGKIIFDAEISADGNLLYFADGEYAAGYVPSAADLAIAARSGERFERLANSAALLAKVNSGALEYAPCISADGLELFFTRSEWSQTAIFRAVRSAGDQPFGAPERVSAIPTGAEGPTLSPDGKSLYYHQREDSGFVLYQVAR